MRKTVFFIAALFGELLSAQTLTLISGNGQLQPDSPTSNITPITFKVTATGDPSSPGLAGQLITFTTTNGLVPLSAYSATTGPDGTASVNFVSGPIAAGPTYLQYSITASIPSRSTYPFTETSYYVDPGTDFEYAQTQLVSPTNLTSVPYLTQAGIGGAPIQVRVYASGGLQSGQTIGNVAMRAILLPPYGNGSTVQSVRCKESNPADQEGNVYTTFVAGSAATCTPIFALPNSAFPPGTNSFQFEILIGDHFSYGPITYTATVAPITVSGGLVNAEAPFPATQLTVSGGVPPYSYTVASGTLPAGVSLDPQTGIVSGTPTGTPGIYAYTVRVQDTAGASATIPQSIALTNGAVTPSAIVLSAYVGEQLSSTISVTGGVPPLTVKTVAGLPSGVTGQISGSSVLISGTAAALPAPLPITISGVDAVLIPFTVVVDYQVYPDLTVAAENPQTALIGVPIAPIAILPGSGELPYSFTATGLPTGLTIDATTGTISGTVTGTAPGVYTATVTVTDALGEIQMITPVFYVESGSLAVVATSVPAAFTALPYQTTLQFAGGVPLSSTPAYTVALGPNAPAGITLVNGVLSATFTAPGTVNVPVSVTDGTGVSTAIQFPIVVQNVAVVNSGSFVNSGVVAPGEIVSIFGSGFGPTAGMSGTLDATTGNLSTTLSGVEVLFGTTPAPIFFENSTQINVQVPYELTVGANVPVVISINNTPYTVLTALPVAESDPGLFADFPVGYTPGAAVQAIALNDISGVQSLNSAANAVPRGQYIILYATGGGTLSAPLADGAAAGTSPLINVIDNPQLTIGGQPVTPAFAGMAPGFIGLIQINALVPASVTPGPAVPVVLSFGGLDNHVENTTIAVQ